MSAAAAKQHTGKSSQLRMALRPTTHAALMCAPPRLYAPSHPCGMVVFRARCVYSGAVVALKGYSREMLVPQTRERIYNEVQTLQVTAGQSGCVRDPPVTSDLPASLPGMLSKHHHPALPRGWHQPPSPDTMKP